jgi:hypothetical protein
VARWASEKVDVAAPELERRAAARRIADRLRELDPAALRGAVTKVAGEKAAVPVAVARARPAARVEPIAAAATASPAPRTGAPQTRGNAQRPAAAAAAKVAVATLEAPAPALSEAVIVELRGALRGRTTAELASVLEAPVTQVEAALRALVAQGAAVPRGPRFYLS